MNSNKRWAVLCLLLVMPLMLAAVLKKGPHSAPATTAHELEPPLRVDKTSTYTVLDTECDGNTYFTNSGAAGTIEFDLPADPTGLICTFIVMEAFALRPDPNSTDLISPEAAGKYLTNSTVGGTITFVGVNATTWMVLSSFGTWAAEA